MNYVPQIIPLHSGTSSSSSSVVRVDYDCHDLNIDPYNNTATRLRGYGGRIDDEYSSDEEDSSDDEADSSDDEEDSSDDEEDSSDDDDDSSNISSSRSVVDYDCRDLE
jgi:hypothetical protein